MSLTQENAALGLYILDIVP